MPELERYILHRLAELDAELRAATDGFTFGRYMRALTSFAQDDLSAFFFDIRKDCLYCDAPADPKRRAYRTVLDTLFHALVSTPRRSFPSPPRKSGKAASPVRRDRCISWNGPKWMPTARLTHLMPNGPPSDLPARWSPKPPNNSRTNKT